MRVAFLNLCWHRSIFPGSRPPSIFDTDELNFCVRNGNRWILIAISTDLNGDPWENRTPVYGVRGRRLDRLTNGPRKKKRAGTYLFSQVVSNQVSSAQPSLTSVFGMGTGGSSSPLAPTIYFRVLYPQNRTMKTCFVRTIQHLVKPSTD